MKKSVIIGIVVAIILLIGIILLISNKNINQIVNINIEKDEGGEGVDIGGNEGIGNGESKMEVKSVFNQGEKIPVKYTADGDDVNPGLEISGIPENAKSLVLIMDDPDAPMGTWIHWVVFNIPVSVNKIDEGASPGIVGVNSWGRNNYGGPSPPSGVHRYFFKVYALDSELSLDSSAEKSDVESAMQGHILDHGELMGVYER